jgi:hypothetical protein
MYSHEAGIAQLVERNLAKVEVAGSNPVSRSNFSSVGPHPDTTHWFRHAGSKSNATPAISRSNSTTFWSLQVHSIPVESRPQLLDFSGNCAVYS